MSKRNLVIGSYMGRPILPSIEVQDSTYVFDRIIPYQDDEFPLDRLSDNEILIGPGLIYRQEK